MKIISVQEAQQLFTEGAVFVDIRDADEFSQEYIQGARNIGVDQLNQHNAAGQKVIFYCLSGMRTKSQQSQLGNLLCEEAFLLEGGLRAWKANGLATIASAHKTLPLQQQVQVTAGLLILLSLLFGYFVHPAFLLVTFFVGLGFTFAGLTGFCGMAVLLMKMPWNKQYRNSNATNCSI